MITAARTAGIVVTRGDVPLDRVLAPLAPLAETFVWDNSERQNMLVYGRYRAIYETKAEAILVVDDDVSLSTQAVNALLRAYRPGVLVANMPPEHARRYPDSALVGFGAIFHRDLPDRAFERYLRDGENLPTDVFDRTCDLIFSALTPRKIIDVPFEMLPHTWAENRMYRAEGNSDERKYVLRCARRVRAMAA